jgi:L-aspartate oxidase
MGGVATDLDGRTSLDGPAGRRRMRLATGVHGANRLASNSLLEAAVFGARAGRAAAGRHDGRRAAQRRRPCPTCPTPPSRVLRQAMSRDAGVIRDADGLARLLAVIDALETAHGPCPTLVAAQLIARAALARQESRGGHFRADFPATAAAGADLRHPSRSETGRAVRYAAE